MARYREDAAWLGNVPRNVRVTVYDKGPEPLPGSTRLPNAGREAQTYLHHIVERYDELADLTFLCQGRPFDHVPDFHKHVRDPDRGRWVDDFQWMGFVVDRDDREGRLFRTWSKNEDGRGLRMAEFHECLFDAEMPQECMFMLGAHLAVRRERVQSRSRMFYQRALALSESFPDAAHCFERVWDRVFGVDYFAGVNADIEMPVHLRPVQRLGITWAQAGAARERLFGGLACGGRVLKKRPSTSPGTGGSA